MLFDLILNIFNNRKENDRKENDRKENDDGFIKRSEIYIPEDSHPSKAEVRRIELSYEQAVQQGWHFKRKSRRRIRITRYTGSERDIIIPAVIDGSIVNEIGKTAFRYRKDIDSVNLPDTVKKLKENCFYRSSVKTVVFAEGVSEIPESAFESCEELERVHLPTTLMSIGNKAFFCCKKLSCIDIPCNRIGEEAFRCSGLKGFAYERKIFYDENLYADGSAFSNTPMQESYKLILHKTKAYGYDILLVGTLAEVKLPGGSVHLNKNSVMHGCRLDFSECTSVSADPEAFNCGRACGVILSHPACTVIMPYGENKTYIPDFIDSYYPDGKKYIGGITVKSKTADKTVLYANTYKLPPFSVKCGAKHIEILSPYDLEICSCAVSSGELESLEIEKMNTSYFEGKLFSAYCRHLHRFSWNGNSVYIPSDEIILHQAHTEMLKAFTKKYNGTSWSFFDSSCIDRVFTEPVTVNRYVGKSKRKGLSRRNKILIAIDILRSSEGLFENREMYEKYLRTHKTYAEKICRELPEKWREYEIFLRTCLHKG